MREKKYLVPEGMLISCLLEGGYGKWETAKILEAALRWWGENPRIPSIALIEEDAVISTGDRVKDIQHHIEAWQRRMFIEPEFVPPEEIKDLLANTSDFEDIPFSMRLQDFNEVLIEAFNRGRASNKTV